jgi:hypothetical protein
LLIFSAFFAFFFQFGNAGLLVLRSFLVRFFFPFYPVHNLYVCMYSKSTTGYWEPPIFLTCSVILLFVFLFCFLRNLLYFPAFILAIIFWRALIMLSLSLYCYLYRPSCLLQFSEWNPVPNDNNTLFSSKDFLPLRYLFFFFLRRLWSVKEKSKIPFLLMSLVIPLLDDLQGHFSCIYI